MTLPARSHAPTLLTIATAQPPGCNGAGAAIAAQSPEAGVAFGGIELDAAALANLALLDPTGANRLVPRVLSTYRSSMARLLAQLAVARAQPDHAAMRLVAHTLKSSSASVGALALSVICSDAELALREGRIGGVPHLLDQLVAESARVDAAVLQLLAGP